jgi:EAL domain-containing protein (putative c-di-GMP-specific phosphodiesterase class I)
LLAEPLVVKRQQLTVSASVGVYTYNTATQQKPPPLRCAEVAMQRAKSMARGAAVHFDPEWIKQLDQQRLREEEFVRALEDGQIIAHFQPVISAESGRIVALETLARWQHPERGMISPADFLPLAAELGLMCRLGVVMLRHAFRALSETIKAGYSLQWVSVNLAADQLYDTSLVAELERLLQEFNVASEKIELELVEELICQDSELVRSQLKAISELGFQFAIDDFGTGYSSLSRLKYLPVAKLKVDKSFIGGLPDAEDDKNITRSIIGLAKGMGLQLVSEGVEHQAQAEWLNAMGCDYLQGYFFAKPQALLDILALLSLPYDFLLEQREPWFRVTMSGRLLEVTAGGIWSQQTVEQLHHEVETLVRALPIKDWCALVDGRDWQPGSLQVQASIKKLAESFISNGLKKSAYIAPSDSLSAYQVELMTPKKTGYQRRIFTDRETAIAWLFENSSQQFG